MAEDVKKAALAEIDGFTNGVGMITGLLSFV